MKTHDLHDWLKAGEHYRKKGNYEKALEAFAQARLALLCDLGECLTHLGNLEDAKALFEEVLEANPRTLRANAGMGIVFLLVGDNGSALTAFGNVLHSDPNNVKALCGLGYANKGLGQLNEAYANLLQAAVLDPLQKSALQGLAELALPMGKAAEILPLLYKFQKRHPDDLDITKDISALENSSAPVASVETLREALLAFRSNPDDVHGVTNLITVLNGLGKTKEATEVRATFLARNPGNESALLQI